MGRARTALTAAALTAAGWNLRLLAAVIRWATSYRPTPGIAGSDLHLPVETVTQQLRTIEVLMTRIGRP